MLQLLDKSQHFFFLGDGQRIEMSQYGFHNVVMDMSGTIAAIALAPVSLVLHQPLKLFVNSF